MMMTDDKIRSTIDAYAILFVNEESSDEDIYHAYQQAVKNGTLAAQEAYQQIATASARERYAITFLPLTRNASDIIILNKRKINYIGGHKWLELLDITLSGTEDACD